MRVETNSVPIHDPAHIANIIAHTTLTLLLTEKINNPRLSFDEYDEELCYRELLHTKIKMPTSIDVLLLGCDI